MSISTGKRVIRQEAAGLEALADSLDSSFETAVEWLLGCPKRVICCGVGKSGHIARKTAGTLSSTGTPSFFLHASEAVHGDLGMVNSGDIVILYTQSGETDEVVRLFPSIRSSGAKTILVTGRSESSASRLADLVLSTSVQDEACPHNLAPTTSTTAMLVLSDALAIAVMERRGFSKEDFARFHPSGSLGKRLLLRVTDVMRPLEDCATVSPASPALDVVQAMTQATVGLACVVEADGRLAGIIAESDLRKHLLSSRDWATTPAESFMVRKPALIEENLLAAEALEIFENFPQKIGELPVVISDTLVGVLVLKDLLRSGIL